MRALFFGELKKIFSKKIVIVFIFLLLFVNVFNIFSTVASASDHWMWIDAEKKMYALVEGKINKENVGRIIAYRDRLERAIEENKKIETILADEQSDLLQVNNIIQKLSEAYTYNDRLEVLKENVKVQSSVLAGKENKYLLRVNQKIERTYEDRKITEFYNSKGYSDWFRYDFSSFLVLLLIILSCSAVFAGEKENGMEALILSSTGGRKRLSHCKKASCAVFSAIMAVLFFVSDFLSFKITTGMKGGFLPLYALEEYEYTPLGINIFEFSIILLLVKALGFVLISYFVCIFSSCFSKSYVVFFLSLCFSFGLMYVCSYSGEKMAFVNFFNPIKLLTARNMFKSFSVARIASYPVDRFTVTAFGCWIVLIVLSLLTDALNSKGQRREKCEFAQGREL